MKSTLPITDSEIALTLNDCSIDAIIALNESLEIVSWNAAAEIFYNHKKSEVIGRPLFEVLPGLEEDEETTTALKNALRGFKSFVPASARFVHRSHTEQHFLALNDKVTGFTGVMIIVHDVAHRIKAEQQLKLINNQLERTLDELATFTYQSSDNIKQPIRHIYTTIEHMIKTEARQLSNGAKASFRRIQSAINRMDLLLDDLLKLSRINIKEKPENLVNLNQLLETVLETMQKKVLESNAKITVDRLCNIKGNTDQLQLLFQHLIDNAIKFNENEKPQIEINCNSISFSSGDTPGFSGAYMKVSVKDNGIGFDQSEAGRIFNMFEKLHPAGSYRGSGTGLAIVQKIMDAHGGFMQVESTKGSGSTFLCFFPAN